jgi:hypothetical protein
MMPASKSDQLWRPVLLASGANSAGQWWWRPVVLPSDAVQFAGRLGKSIAQRAHSCTHMLECTASSSNLIYLLQKQRLRALCGSGKVFPFSGVPDQHSGRDSKFGHFLYKNDDFEHFSALGRFSGSQNSGMASKFDHFFFYRNNDFEHFSALGGSSPFLGSQNNILAGIPNLIFFCYRNDDLEHFSALGGSSSFLGFQNDILAGIPNLIISCFFAWRLG